MNKNIPKTDTQSKPLKKPRFSLRTKIIFIVVLVALAAALAVSIYAVTKKSNTGTTSGSGTQAPVVSSKIATIQAQATAVAAQQGTAAAQQLLTDSLSSATTATDKAAIYTQKAYLASTDGGGSNNTDALTFAQQAEDAQPTSASAAYLAGIQVEQGDKASAIKNYQLAIDRLNAAKGSSSDQQGGDGNTAGEVLYYQNVIKGLQS